MRLKLRWARFFTTVGWDWRLSSQPGFDFKVTIPCTHSECGGSHVLLVQVAEQERDALAASYHKRFTSDEVWSEPHPALFGDGPQNTHWEMPHGAGGGTVDVTHWVHGADRIWRESAGD